MFEATSFLLMILGTMYDYPTRSLLIDLQVNSAHPLSLSIIFVRDGILSVADYNSTLMGVVVVVVVVNFTMG